MTKKIAFCLLIIVTTLSCKKGSSGGGIITPVIVPLASVTYRGADLSFSPIIETAATKFYNGSGVQSSALNILKQSGMNLVRLRLWHTPANTQSSLTEVENFAQTIKAAGINWWLDIHYSDTWADPANQTIPTAWQALPYNILLDSVYNYTYRVMNGLKTKNILPAIVQIGNETNSGMLWNFGKVGGAFDVNWPQYAALVKKGIDAVKAVDPTIKVMLHFAGTTGAQWFFNNIKLQGVNYDIMGLSYYYWWHNRTLTELQTDLNSLVSNFDKDIFIAETAYPFSTGYNDYTNNVYGASNALLSGYDATPAGQLKFLTDLRTVIHNVPNNRGIGFCYWAPDWVAFRGATSTNGSSWENLALFDFANKALPGVDAFAQ
jgi:arabinogalactan endo-1,4-beta-galactosidase